MLDDVANGHEIGRLAEVDLALILDVADELDHVEGVDAQVLDDGIFGDGLRVKILVLDQHVADDVDSCHDGSFRGV